MFRYRRVQLGGGIVCSVIIPLLIVSLRGSGSIDVLPLLYDKGVLNSSLACTLAIVYGFFSWSRLSRMRSFQNIIYLIWAFVPLFVLSIMVMSVFRVEYSRIYIIFSAIICLLWFWIVQFSMNRAGGSKFFVVPGGNVGRVTKVRQIDWRPIGRYDEFLDQFLRRGVDRDIIIVADLGFNHDFDTRRFITQATLKQVPIYHYKKLLEEITGRVNIEYLSENEFGSLLPNSSYLRLRRVLDISLTILIMPMILICLACSMLAVLMIDGRPIFFKQQRVGFRGETFYALKLRTMQRGLVGDRSQSDLGQKGSSERSYVDTSSKSVELDNMSTVTLENDPRITSLGRFLRKSRIDELPQVYNILAGNMSWIGPRPEAIDLARIYESQIPFYSYRHSVRPGITGWAQVMQGHVTSVEDVRQKVEHDFYYIKNFSPLLDLLICIKTVKTVLWGLGAK